tara:strand:+ start:514 stop:1422 length:909 start_codon:yes stop_codon:yes gene_type:complete
MAIILDGKNLAKEIEQRLLHDIQSGLNKARRPPGLAVMRIGDDPASGVYVRNKEKACLRIGVKSFVFHMSEKISTDELLEKIDTLNLDERIDGILLQLPLPAGKDESLLLNAIRPDKDADGLHPLNLGRLIKGDNGPRSCTPAGIMALLLRYKIPLEGKRAVVIGRSVLVGQPMALMLQAANATVTIAHSKTKDLTSITKQAELLIVAAGKPNLIGIEHIQNDAVVIDVGIHRIAKKEPLIDNKPYSLCGDVKSDEVSIKAGAITPVPGGVGPMTVTMLLVNTVSSWQKHCGLSVTLGDLLP